MSNYNIVKDYLTALESAKYVQFTGTGYKLVNNGVEIEFGNEGFEVDGEIVNVEDIKALVKQA
jgi:hypothetical protein